MNSLFTRLALLLAACFAAVVALLAVALQARRGTPADAELWADVVIGGIVVALLAGLGAAWLVARRLARISAAIDAFERDGAQPLRIAGADADGDEVARLAAQVEALAARLAEQKNALDRAARRRHELLANVSHDLRTPLAAMQGYLDLLLLRHASLDAAEARNYLETAARHSERLTRLVRDLFRLTELEAGERAAQVEDFVVAELGHDVLQRFAADAARRGVGLSCEGDPALRTNADIELIERVLESVVENALRHTPAGGEVRISLGRDGARVRIRVADTGEGIATAELPHLFDRYERAPRLAGGAPRAGLGLAIARRIVELHGGRLQVTSTPGRGTEVTFDLAAAAVPAPAACATATHGAGTTPRERALR
jgi:hypothetical protein